jgi:2-keto-4-pentenoate hydratase/2-oxohepta-3-ene-1,7-dioic acid hydratase in catechol pathway
MATKRQATTPKTTKWPHMEAELAVHIAAILEYPFTPENLYNAIVDEMSDMLSDVSAKESRDSAEMIERVLNWHRGFGFRSLGQYAEEKLADGRVVTRLKGTSRLSAKK